MAELDAEDLAEKPAEVKQKEDKTIEDSVAKPRNKSLADLSGVVANDPESETSSIAPEDEITLTGSGENGKKTKVPRKLMEDEKRAHGRIAWPVWRTYFSVSY